MKWFNLKNNKCPKCGKDTALKSPYNFVPATDMFEHPCGFKISTRKLESIVADMNNKSLQENDNQELLNDL